MVLLFFLYHKFDKVLIFTICLKNTKSKNLLLINNFIVYTILSEINIYGSNIVNIVNN